MKYLEYDCLLPRQAAKSFSPPCPQGPNTKHAFCSSWTTPEPNANEGNSTGNGPRWGHLMAPTLLSSCSSTALLLYHQGEGAKKVLGTGLLQHS